MRVAVLRDMPLLSLPSRLELAERNLEPAELATVGARCDILRAESRFRRDGEDVTTAAVEEVGTVRGRASMSKRDMEMALPGVRDWRMAGVTGAMSVRRRAALAER